MNIKKLLVASIFGFLVTAELCVAAPTTPEEEEWVDVGGASVGPESEEWVDVTEEEITDAPVPQEPEVSIEPWLRKPAGTQRDTFETLRSGVDPETAKRKTGYLDYLTRLSSTKDGAQQILSCYDATKSASYNYDMLLQIWYPNTHAGDKQFAQEITKVLDAAWKKITEEASATTTPTKTPEETQEGPSRSLERKRGRAGQQGEAQPTTPTKAPEKTWAEIRDEKKEALRKRTAEKRTSKFGE